MPDRAPCRTRAFRACRTTPRRHSYNPTGAPSPTGAMTTSSATSSASVSRSASSAGNAARHQCESTSTNAVTFMPKFSPAAWMSPEHGSRPGVACGVSLSRCAAAKWPHDKTAPEIALRGRFDDLRYRGAPFDKLRVTRWAKTTSCRSRPCRRRHRRRPILSSVPACRRSASRSSGPARRSRPRFAAPSA